jgi:hypothetical protein
LCTLNISLLSPVCKGLLASALQDDNPIITCLQGRWRTVSAPYNVRITLLSSVCTGPTASALQELNPIITCLQGLWPTVSALQYLTLLSPVCKTVGGQCLLYKILTLLSPVCKGPSASAPHDLNPIITCVRGADSVCSTRF